MQELTNRVLLDYGVNQSYKVTPNKNTAHFSCDENKRKIYYSPDILEIPNAGTVAYLLIIHESIHAKQNEHFRDLRKGNVLKNSSDINRLSTVFLKSSCLPHEARGYIKSAATTLISSNAGKQILELIYRFQPSEYEAYKKQYETAKELEQFLECHREKIKKYNEVRARISIERMGFERMVANAQNVFESERPWLEIDKSLWNLKNNKECRSLADIAFRTGAMITGVAFGKDKNPLEEIKIINSYFEKKFANFKTARVSTLQNPIIRTPAVDNKDKAIKKACKDLSEDKYTDREI